MIIYGKNAILEALKSEKTFNKLTIDKENHDKGLQEIIDLAKKLGIKIDFINRVIFDKKVFSIKEGRGKNEKINHQGVIGEIVDFEYSSLEDIFALAKGKGESPFIIILDGIEDPHNLGAILRTAECAGVDGVIIPEHRACAINDTVLKTSAGAASNVNVVRVTNISHTIDELKKRGVWVYACEVGGQNLFKAKLTGAIAIVVGSEGQGMSRLVKENCDDIITIPMKGKINSLNVSVACAIATFEVLKQR